MLEGTHKQVALEDSFLELSLLDRVDREDRLVENQAQIDNSNSTLVFNHNTVARAAGIAAYIGNTLGRFFAAALAPRVAQAASDRVRHTLTESGDEIVEKILKVTGLDKVPGSSLLIKNQVAEAAHNAGEATYSKVKSKLADRGATVGGVTAGITTIALMEGINLASHLHSGYVTPYFEQRRERAITIASQQQLISSNQEPVKPIEMDDEFGFVMVEAHKVEKPSN